MTVKRKNKVVQEQFTLHSGLKDSEIRNLVQNGVPITCFEANPERTTGQQKKAMRELTRFVTKVTDERKRMSETVRTKLKGSDIKGAPRVAPEVPATPPAPVKNVAAIELGLVKAGIDFETAELAAKASKGELKEMDYKAIGKQLGLTGNFGLQKVYDAING